MQDQNTIFCLALLQRVHHVREDELVKLLTDSLYLDFFQAKQAIARLLDRGLLTLSERKDESELDSSGKRVLRYNLKPEGAAVADLLFPELPENMQAYLERLGSSFKRERMSASKAEISEIDGQKVKLKLSASEGRELLFQLELQLPTRELAEKIKADWARDPAALYQSIILSLCDPN
ncbi:MAG: DUF4364 family protein [Eubacteriales bacterium]|nr:DUF4364 family protein [Eubacteriales bacterium]